MKPSIGRIVIVVSSQAANNGADRAPAIITRVWGNPVTDTCEGPVNVNVSALPDCGHHVQCIPTVPLYDTEADAADCAELGMPYAYWPERVS